MSIQESPPVVEAAADWTFPVAHQSRLDNGMRVLAYDCPGQYVVAVSLHFAVPLSVERRDIEGVAELTGRCLAQGAGGRDAEQFADALALCGADISTSATPDAFVVRLSAPTTHLEAAMGLLADAVTRPAFIAEEFDNEKRLRLQEIEQAHAYPQHVAVEELNAALLGESREARPSGGTTQTVQAVTRDDVAAYAAAHLQPGSATLVVAGDLSVTDPVRIAAETLGGWRHEGDAPHRFEPPVVSREPQLLLVDWPGAPQATIRIAGAAIGRAERRWAAMFVANYAVGGNFSSRINTVLREEKGVTYGANSGLDTGRGAGVLTVATAVRSDSTAASVADIVAILREAAGTLTDDEVANAVKAATDSAALGFERADAVVSRVEMLLSEDLPLDHVDRNLARLRQVTTQEANAAYRAIVEPAGLTVVVVADAASAREPLAALGYAELREISSKRR